MKSILLILTCFIIETNLFSQTSTITTWIKNNPEVTFIESKNLQNFSDSEISKLNTKLIVFDSEIKEEDIMKFDKNFSTENSNIIVQASASKTQSQEVKDWKNQNPFVKVVPQSVYKNSSQEIRAEYHANNCMILFGEELTEEDVKNYKF
ncbi:MAG: hypothetical protein V4622_00850 [Bacteroidota bacterium]